MENSILNNALLSEKCIISVMGPHANEDVNTIFLRKIEDTKQIGWTIWLVRSNGAKPFEVQNWLNNDTVENSYVIFVKPSSKTIGDGPSLADKCQQFSADGISWSNIPDKMGNVTGKFDKKTCGLIFDKLIYFSDESNNQPTIDLSLYEDPYKLGYGIKIYLGNSTVIAKKEQNCILKSVMISKDRRIVGVGKLKYPYGVWLR